MKQYLTILKKLFWISRPISWPNTAYPFAAGFLVTGGQFGWLFIVATLFFLAPYNLLMYGINDIYDYESDIKNPRKGGIEGMREQKVFHPIVFKASIILTIPFVVALLFVGSLLSKLILLALVFFVLSYSIKGLRFKEIPVLDSINSSIHFVGPLIYALSLTGFSLVTLPFVIAFFMWGMASHAFGAVQDIIPDRTGKIRSIATVFGASTTVKLSLLLYSAASLLVVFQGALPSIIGLAGLVYVANIWPYRDVTDKQSSITNKAWRRFIYLNLCIGFITTLVLIYQQFVLV